MVSDSIRRGGQAVWDCAASKSACVSSAARWRSTAPLDAVPRCRFACLWESWSQRLRVLLADDHAIVRRGLRSLIETQADITVEAEAADGLEALRLCEEHQPDVVILDVAMPKLNGIEVAERVQKLPRP